MNTMIPYDITVVSGLQIPVTVPISMILIEHILVVIKMALNFIGILMISAYYDITYGTTLGSVVSSSLRSTFLGR
jgi:hypothetical protein